MPHDVRDQIVDFVRRWSEATGIGAVRFIEWLATVFSEESVGIAFAIFQIQVNPFEDIGQTQIAIAAQNVNPENVVDYTYWCSYVVIGQLQEGSKPVKK